MSKSKVHIRRIGMILFAVTIHDIRIFGEYFFVFGDVIKANSNKTVRYNTRELHKSMRAYHE